MAKARTSSRPDTLPPLDPDMVRLVEALAVAVARRDHRAALAQRDEARAKRK